MLWETGHHGASLGVRLDASVLVELTRLALRWCVSLTIRYGASCDAHHITTPEPEGKGLASALEVGLASAGINKEEVRVMYIYIYIYICVYNMYGPQKNCGRRVCPCTRRLV
jgi:hypothetical protein